MMGEPNDDATIATIEKGPMTGLNIQFTSLDPSAKVVTQKDETTKTNDSQLEKTPLDVDSKPPKLPSNTIKPPVQRRDSLSTKATSSSRNTLSSNESVRSSQSDPTDHRSSYSNGVRSRSPRVVRRPKTNRPTEELRRSLSAASPGKERTNSASQRSLEAQFNSSGDQLSIASGGNTVNSSKSEPSTSSSHKKRAPPPRPAGTPPQPRQRKNMATTTTTAARGTPLRRRANSLDLNRDNDEKTSSDKNSSGLVTPTRARDDRKDAPQQQPQQQQMRRRNQKTSTRSLGEEPEPRNRDESRRSPKGSNQQGFSNASSQQQRRGPPKAQSPHRRAASPQRRGVSPHRRAASPHRRGASPSRRPKPDSSDVGRRDDYAHHERRRDRRPNDQDRERRGLREGEQERRREQDMERRRERDYDRRREADQQEYGSRDRRRDGGGNRRRDGVQDSVRRREGGDRLESSQRRTRAQDRESQDDYHRGQQQQSRDRKMMDSRLGDSDASLTVEDLEDFLLQRQPRPPSDHDSGSPKMSKASGRKTISSSQQGNDRMSRPERQKSRRTLPQKIPPHDQRRRQLEERLSAADRRQAGVRFAPTTVFASETDLGRRQRSMGALMGRANDSFPAPGHPLMMPEDAYHFARQQQQYAAAMGNPNYSPMPPANYPMPPGPGYYGPRGHPAALAYDDPRQHRNRAIHDLPPGGLGGGASMSARMLDPRAAAAAYADPRGRPIRAGRGLPRSVSEHYIDPRRGVMPDARMHQQHLFAAPPYYPEDLLQQQRRFLEGATGPEVKQQQGNEKRQNGLKKLFGFKGKQEAPLTHDQIRLAAANAAFASVPDKM